MSISKRSAGSVVECWSANRVAKDQIPANAINFIFIN